MLVKNQKDHNELYCGEQSTIALDDAKMTRGFWGSGVERREGWLMLPGNFVMIKNGTPDVFNTTHGGCGIHDDLIGCSCG